MEPVIVQSIFESAEMLKSGMLTLKHKCIDGITAKEALETNRGVYELCIEKGLLSKEELDKILSPERMIKPQKMK
ncbi:MAG: hypothetical protein DRJ15_05050 [Bacteroidetes bacterium]|nr:MAG: hypothetical protein DRJ15_05050 [Bacteroidota bacterium]